MFQNTLEKPITDVTLTLSAGNSNKTLPPATNFAAALSSNAWVTRTSAAVCSSTLGAKTLEAALQKFPNARYLQMARDIALSHHERFDGKGYPSGLSGEEIPLSGRIMALADVYDALTSKKVYRDGYSHEEAESMILDESGSHFDPAVVEAFEHHRETFQEIRERFQALEMVK